VPLSRIEGINGNRQYYLPHFTSLDICTVDTPESWLIKQVLEVMFQGCGLRELQTFALNVANHIPSDRSIVAMSVATWISLYLDIVDENTSPLFGCC